MVKKPKNPTQQIVFIDDSGDPGFKIEKGASSHFVIACVIFDDTLEAEKTAVAIKQLRRDLKFSDNTEFKFNGSRDAVRIQFLKTISQYNFRVRSIAVDKKTVTSPELRNTADSFYNYFIKLVLQHNQGTIKEAKIRLDGHGDRRFRRNLTKYLRKNLNNKQLKVMQSMRLVNSKRDVLIQMADMVAGSIRKSHEDKTKKNIKYKQIIKGKIEDDWLFK